MLGGIAVGAAQPDLHDQGWTGPAGTQGPLTSLELGDRNILRRRVDFVELRDRGRLDAAIETDADTRGPILHWSLEDEPLHHASGGPRRILP